MKNHGQGNGILLHDMLGTLGCCQLLYALSHFSNISPKKYAHLDWSNSSNWKKKTSFLDIWIINETRYTQHVYLFGSQCD